MATRNPDDAAVADTSDSHAATPQHRIELESGTCSDSLKNAEYSPYNFCSGVIYYDFYVGHDQTLASLDAEAYARGAAIPPLFNSDCLSDLKRMICADVYKPCVSENPVPPCGSLCTDIVTTCPAVVFALGLPGTNCTDGSTYDLTGTSDNCNDLALTAGMQLVSNSKEPYVGTYCEGITTGDIYIANLPFPYAPFLPPMVNQILIDEYLKGVGAFIPPVLTPSCLLSRRKVECGAVYMPAEENTQLYAYHGESSMFPQFPHQSVCTDFLEQCAGAIAMFPDLGMNCTEDSFPSQPKHILNLYGIDIYTEVNYMNDTTKVFIPECPYGFQPTDSTDTDRMVGAEPSGCFMECLGPIYTPEEYNVFRDYEFAINIIGFFVFLIGALNIYLTPAKKRNIYLSFLVALEFVLALNRLAQLFEYVMQGDAVPGTMRTCDSPLEWVALEGSCQFEALLAYFGHWSQLLIFLSATSELWLRVVPQVKKLNKYHFVLPLFILMLSLSLTMLLGGDGMLFDAGSSTIYCSVHNNSDFGEISADISSGIIYTAAALYIWAIWKCIATTLSANKAENPFTKLWRTYRVLFYIGFMSVFLLVKEILSRFRDNDKIGKSFNDWTLCLFMEYINPNQDDYLEFCGKHPKNRLSLSELQVEQTIHLLIVIVIFCASLHDHAYNEYFKLLAYVEYTFLGTSYIENNLMSKKMNINAFATSQVSKGVNSSNVVQSTVLDSSYEAVEKYKPAADMDTIKEASSRKYVVAPITTDAEEESKDRNPDETAASISPNLVENEVPEQQNQV